MTPIQTIYYVIVLTALFIGMVRYKKLTIPFKILTLSVLVTFLLDVISKFLAIKYKNNALSFHFMSIFSYVFYSAIYFLLFKSEGIRKAIKIFIPLIIVFFVINILYIQQPVDKQFPTNIYFITNILYVVISLLMFKQMLQYPLNLNIVKQSAFWFNTALLIFSTTMFLNMGLLNYYAAHHWARDIIYYFWVGNFCLFNILICVSLLLDGKANNA
jgi:hypothetical protein